MRSFSDAARNRLTEPWEECVLYVYDDKVPKRHMPDSSGRSVLRYPEWDGNKPVGTLTIGFGHTNAAGGLRIVKGLQLTRAQADDLLSADLAPCVAKVNALLEVEVTQHQFDMLIDTYFNCPKAAIEAVRLYNAGQGDKVASKLLQYTFSKGEHMEGLTHRRTAEIAWGNTPDHLEAPPAPNPEVVFCPKAERNPPPKSIVQSKTGTAAATVSALSIAEAARSANEALEPLKQVKGSLDELGLFDHLGLLAQNPTVLACALVAALCVFIIWDRHSKLVNDHV